MDIGKSMLDTIYYSLSLGRSLFIRSGVREVQNEELLIRELRARIKSDTLEIFTGPPASEANKLAAHAKAFANAAVLVGTSTEA